MNVQIESEHTIFHHRYPFPCTHPHNLLKPSHPFPCARLTLCLYHPRRTSLYENPCTWMYQSIGPRHLSLLCLLSSRLSGPSHQLSLPATSPNLLRLLGISSPTLI